MFRILCITTGDYIKIKAEDMWEFTHKMPPEIREQISPPLLELTSKAWTQSTVWNYVEFETEEAAKWFISHRLVYNPRRKDTSKLEFMRNLFEYNQIPGWETIKIEFEVIKV